MVPDLHAASDLLEDELRVGDGLPSDDEEGRAASDGREEIEDGRCVTGVGAIVEGEGEDAFPGGDPADREVPRRVPATQHVDQLERRERRRRDATQQQKDHRSADHAVPTDPSSRRGVLTASERDGVGAPVPRPPRGPLTCGGAPPRGP